MSSVIPFRSPMAASSTSPRWRADITYRSKLGPLTITHEFEELEELQDLVEASFDRRCIMSFEVKLVRGACALTIEEADQQ